MFLAKGVLKICSKFTGEHPCRSVILIEMQSNFTEIALRHGCSPVSLLHIFRIPFSKIISGGLLLPLGILTAGLFHHELDSNIWLCSCLLKKQKGEINNSLHN